MLNSKIKVAYATFLFSFSTWLILTLIFVFPSLNVGLQIQFSNPTFLTFLTGSTIISSFSGTLIGLQLIRSKNKTKKILEEKNSTIYELNLSTEEITANTLKREKESTAKPKKTIAHYALRSKL